MLVGQRWVNEFSDYRLTIHYKVGGENIVADALSRPNKLAIFRDKEKEFTISPEDVSV